MSSCTFGYARATLPCRIDVGEWQVGGAAVWAVGCKGNCGESIAPLKTSAPLYGDDFEVNHTIHYASVTCAVPFERVNAFMRTMGCAPPLFT